MRSPFGTKHHVVVQYMARWMKCPLPPPPPQPHPLPDPLPHLEHSPPENKTRRTKKNQQHHRQRTSHCSCLEHCFLFRMLVLLSLSPRIPFNHGALSTKSVAPPWVSPQTRLTRPWVFPQSRLTRTLGLPLNQTQQDPGSSPNPDSPGPWVFPQTRLMPNLPLWPVVRAGPYMRSRARFFSIVWISRSRSLHDRRSLDPILTIPC